MKKGLRFYGTDLCTYFLLKIIVAGFGETNHRFQHCTIPVTFFTLTELATKTVAIITAENIPLLHMY